MKTEGTWLSLASIPRAARDFAAVPAAAGYVSLGSAVLLGRSIGQALRAASRALDHVAANTAQIRASYGALWSGVDSQPGEAGMPGRVAGGVGEAYLANESQWIIWSDEDGADEWADVAVRLDWARLAPNLHPARQGREEQTAPAAPQVPHPRRRGPARARPPYARSSRKTRRNR